MAVQNVIELEVYKKAYQQAMNFFEISRLFPAEERYALTSQGRRSSRSVPMNLREAWAKRRYVAHFVSKLTDCDGENSETETSLDFARDCGYITPDEHIEMTTLNHEIGKMLGAMIKNPEKFLLTPDARPLTPKL
jgi:four helix bundle protein